MLKAFQGFIAKNKLCSTRDKILLALSGGADSVVLLTLLLESGYIPGIAHCNFKLRGAESDADEDFVRSIALKLKLELFVKVCDAAQYAEEKKLSVQEAARNLRYAWFEEVSSRESFGHIAIAHHLDDQVETFFINLFRGSGVEGLKGMPLKRGKIIRPLLFATRREIEQFATINGLKFRADSSNTSDKYLRNSIRNNLLPVMKKISPQAETPIARSLQYLQEDALLFQQLLKEKRATLLTRKGENIHLPLSGVKNHRPTEAWLFYLLKDFHFSRETTDGLYRLLQNDETTHSGKVFYSATHQLLIDRKQLIIRKRNPESPPKYFSIREHDHEIKTPLHLRFSFEKNKENYPFDTNPSLAYFNVDRLAFPLKLRRWKQGDRFAPFGMKGSKLVSDYFIDKKLDRFTKENTWLLLSGEEIIWVFGPRSSERFRVGKGCSGLLKVQVFAQDNPKHDR
ncbi:MAG: tRNA lysidine(34) synthetase TilS [Bacteroidales bacterium]|nr:tRNA lysidine(34) synthetase TilS [Bacteroidales bacterium]